ncbi:MAG: bifunctional diguanylate cyclase/phosphodiesterase [Castellaniella sp.]
MNPPALESYPSHEPSRLERWFQNVALYLIPLCLALASLLVIFQFDEAYPTVSSTPVTLDILPVAAPEVDNRTGAQAWLRLSIPPQAAFIGHILEIPSRHIEGMLCWDGDSMQLLHIASRSMPSRQGRLARMGLAVELGPLDHTRTVLCHGSFVQDSGVRAHLWTLPDFQQASSRFDHGMGLLEGGLLSPALLVLIIALLTRESSYALLALWLLANLRLGSFAIGWDAQWLGHLLPIDIMPLVRHATVAVYHLLTVALLLRLLKVNRYMGSQRLRRLSMILSLALLLAAFVAPAPWFWPITTLVTAASLVLAFLLLGRLRRRTRMLIWFWQTASLVLAHSMLLGLALFVWLADIEMLDGLTTTALLLGSSVAVILAVAERLRNARNEQERRLAELDPVTGALNLQSMETEVTEALSQVQQGRTASLAHLNMHRFQGINKLLGYAAGDRLLREISTEISNNLKLRCQMARTEGDEFTILFPGRSARAIEPSARALIDHLDSHAFVVGTHRISIRMSMGIIDLDEGGNAGEALFTARRACQDARREGQAVLVYGKGHPALREHQHILELLKPFRTGLSPRGLRVELQPILSLAKPAHWGFEALLRARNDAGQVLPTGRVVATAEDIGLIVALDKWVCNTILGWMQSQVDRLGSEQFITLNISRISLNSEEFSHYLFGLLERWPALRRRVIIEITERTVMDSMERSQRTVDSLRALGVRISLDDFGAGYTSFSHLRTFGVDLLKIDGNLIRSMRNDPDNIAIVRSIVQLAKHLGMMSVAEWVEDHATLGVLREMGVDYIQGFVVAPAMPPNQAIATKFSV